MAWTGEWFSRISARDLMPGWRNKGTVGYHTDDRKIFDSENSSTGKRTIGM